MKAVNDIFRLPAKFGLAAIALFLAGCGSGGPGAEGSSGAGIDLSAEGEVLDLRGKPIYYFAEMFNPGFEIDRSMRVGSEHREVFVTHLETRFKNVPPDDNDNVDLIELVAPDRLSGHAFALEARIESNFEPVIRYAALPDSLSGDQPSPVLVDVLPEDTRELRAAMRTRSGPISDNIEVRVRELLDPNQAYTTVPLRVDAAHRLAGAVANPTYTGSGVRFRIEAVTANSSPEIVWESTVDSTSENTDPEWSAFDVDLEPYAGRETRLRFVSSATQSRRGAAPLWGNVHIYSGQAPVERPRPNLLLISLDTVRADRLSLYGYERPTSPNLIEFAKRSTVFDAAFSPTSWTLPVHAGIFTGLHPIAQPRTFDKNIYQLSHELETLAESARRARYATAAFTEGILVSGDLNLDQGFARHDDGPGRTLPPGTAAQTFSKARNWLESYGHLPHFLFVHTYQAHSPYHPSASAKDAFAPNAPPRMAVEDPLPAAERDHASNLYDAEISDIDAALGTFLNELDSSGALDNTVVIVLSDHGEEFMEHGRMSHGKSLHRESLHVPLLVRMPGQSEGRRVSDLVSLLDLHSTIADLLSLDAEYISTSISLAPLLRGDVPPPERRGVTGSLVRLGLHFLQVSHQTDSGKYIGVTSFDTPQSPLAAFDELIAADRDPHRALMMYLREHPSPLSAPDSGWTTFSDGAGARELYFSLPENAAELTDESGDQPDRVLDYRERTTETVDRILDTMPGGAQPEAVSLTREEEEALEAIGYLGN